MCRRICSVRLVSFVNDVNRTNIFLEKNKIMRLVETACYLDICKVFQYDKNKR